MAASEVRSVRHTLALAALTALALTMLAIFWTGFLASDDIYYYQGGRAWLTEAWHVPRSFGEVRTTVTLPIAMSLSLFGDSEFAVSAPTCLYMILTVLLMYTALSRLMPASHAFVTSALFSVLPVLVLEATTASADLAEIFWISVAYWSFVAATRDGRGKTSLLIGAGVAAGLGFTAHETVLAFMVFLGVLFLLGYGIPRWRYWLMAVGFFIVIGTEAAYYWFTVHDPLYRFNLLLKGFAISTDRDVVPPFTFDSAGTFRIWPPIDSLVMVLTRHNFALVYFAIIPTLFALFVFARRRRQAGTSLAPWTEQALLAALLGLVWFVFASVILARVALLARYYLPPTYFMLIASSLMISHEVYARRTTLIRCTVAGLFIVCMAAIGITDRNPRAGERAVAAYLQANPGVVVTDPKTAFRSQWFVQWAGQDLSRIADSPPKFGDRYLFNPPNASQPNRLLSAAEVPLYAPASDWPLVWSTQQPAPLIGQLIARLGLASYVPEQIRKKLVEPKPPIHVYEVTTSRGDP